MIGDLEVSSLPDRLVAHDQWVCWQTKDRDGKATKVPIDPAAGGFASSTDSDTWTDVEAALAHLESGDGNGLGFVFTVDDSLVGVDLDDCRNPETGAIDAEARDVIRRLDSYTEVSPSGTGFHVLVRGELPDGRNRRGSIECYDRARFFTVTGDVVADRPKRIGNRQDALEAIHREYLAEDSPDAPSDDGSSARAESNTRASAVGITTGLGDDALLERARSAANGAKFERLWNGRSVGYDSHSEADMALCCLLAFWTGGDRMQMDRLFRRSGLLRDKWDEVHYADGATYGERTIERAVATTSEFYDPETEAESESDDGTRSADESAGSTAPREERVRLLVDRVETLETALARREDEIDSLEMALEERGGADTPSAPMSDDAGSPNESDEGIVTAGTPTLRARVQSWIEST